MQSMLFGEPSEPQAKITANYLPLFLHILLVLAAGLWLPEPVVRWFREVAGQLG
jgi:hydrogenase-4 component F